jgi:hypothetical protein
MEDSCGTPSVHFVSVTIQCEVVCSQTQGTLQELLLCSQQCPLAVATEELGKLHLPLSSEQH